MLNECYVYAHFVFNLFLSSSVVNVRLLKELYHTSLCSKKSHFVFTPLIMYFIFIIRQEIIRII